MALGPNPISVGLSVVRALVSVRRPGPFGTSTVDHSLLTTPLRRLDAQNPEILSDVDEDLGRYLDHVTGVNPGSLTESSALAYWINVYNAGALRLAARAKRAGAESVLGIPGGFGEEVVTVDGENLSLDDIEHGKLRRFGDPRIHAALVCGSVSCPTLRSEPYEGDRLGDQLNDQLRHFLASGALSANRDRAVVHLSRVFLWFGADFTRPHRMPTFLPARRSRVLTSLRPWMDPGTNLWVEEVDPAVEYQGYDWGLSCTVR
jgi:hypothetical protein